MGYTPFLFVQIKKNQVGHSSRLIVTPITVILVAKLKGLFRNPLIEHERSC